MIVLGSFIALSRSSYIPDPTTTVEMPSSSINLAMCPTDTWQTGQTGTIRSASIWSSINLFAQRGPVSFFSRIWEHAPTKEKAV